MLIDNWWVQGRSGSDRELWDTAALVGHLVPAGSVYGFLAEHRREVFPDGLFADLFPSGRGRPGRRRSAAWCGSRRCAGRSRYIPSSNGKSPGTRVQSPTGYLVSCGLATAGSRTRDTDPRTD
jgi:hypothetical protein